MGSVHTYLRRESKMGGGIIGGVVLLEPNLSDYDELKKVLKKGKCDSNTKCDLTCGHCTVTPPPPPPPLCSNEKSKKFCTKQAKKSNCGQKKAIKKCALTCGAC